MIRTARAAYFLFAALLAGCAGEAVKTVETQKQVAEEIDAILTQPLGEDEYVKSERCISTFQYDSVEVLDKQHVLFKGRGDHLWVNTLRVPCIGLRRRDVLQFELRGSQLCNLDDFVAIARTPFFGTKTSASCALGDFSPITQEQVELLKETVKKRRD